MKPSGRPLPRSSTLKTARLLASALATNSSLPSGVRLKLLGVLPAGASGYREADRVCKDFPLLASSTLTFVELAQAMNRVLPSGDRTISVGWLSVFQWAETFA